MPLIFVVTKAPPSLPLLPQILFSAICYQNTPRCMPSPSPRNIAINSFSWTKLLVHSKNLDFKKSSSSNRKKWRIFNCICNTKKMKYLPYQCASISCNEKKDFNSVPKLGPTPPQLPHPSQKYHQTTPTNALPLKWWTLEKWADCKPMPNQMLDLVKNLRNFFQNQISVKVAPIETFLLMITFNHLTKFLPYWFMTSLGLK